MTDEMRGRGPLPPVYLLAALLLAVALHFLAPITTIIPNPFSWIGVAIIIIGVLVVVFPAVSFTAADAIKSPMV